MKGQIDKFYFTKITARDTITEPKGELDWGNVYKSYI